MEHGGRLIVETANTDLDEAYAWLHADVQPGAYACLSVTDTGSGMTEEVRAHLFEPFFTTKEVGKGTGLGLATVYGIIKQSGGHIEVRSAPNQGTTFAVYLPQILESGRREKQAAAQARPPTGSETILLVEDEEMVRTLTGTILKKNGYTVLEAEHGFHALRIGELHAGPIHLMVTDVVMPQLNGRDLFDRLVRRRPALKVIYISGYPSEAIGHLGIMKEGTTFLQKPFVPELLARKVREVLDK
jgi:CheY-like chemotaxis protein